MRSADGLSVCIYLYHVFNIPIRKRRNVVCILKAPANIALCRRGCRVMNVVCALKGQLKYKGIGSVALSGRLLPLRAETQGAALGYYKLPFQGVNNNSCGEQLVL
jgi:hypothetical protein